MPGEGYFCGSMPSVAIDYSVQPDEPRPTTPFNPIRLTIIRTAASQQLSIPNKSWSDMTPLPMAVLHHTWTGPREDQDPRASERGSGLFEIYSANRNGGITPDAWYGPIWDEGTPYVAVVEFEDGETVLAVRSPERELYAAH